MKRREENNRAFQRSYYSTRTIDTTNCRSYCRSYWTKRRSCHCRMSVSNWKYNEKNVIDQSMVDSAFLRCSHMCMVMRGAQKVNSRTTTSAMLGVFREDPKTREEFLTLGRITPFWKSTNWSSFLLSQIFSYYSCQNKNECILCKLPFSRDNHYSRPFENRSIIPNRNVSDDECLCEYTRNGSQHSYGHSVFFERRERTSLFQVNLLDIYT